MKPARFPGVNELASLENTLRDLCFEYRDEMLEADPITFMVYLRSDLLQMLSVTSGYLDLLEYNLENEGLDREHLAKLVKGAKGAVASFPDLRDAMDKYIAMHSQK